MQEAEEQILANERNGNRTKLRLGAMPKSELKNFLDNGIANADGVAFDTKPIADLFPSTTVSWNYECCWCWKPALLFDTVCSHPFNCLKDHVRGHRR